MAITKPQYTKQQLKAIIWTGSPNKPIPTNTQLVDYKGMGYRAIEYAVQHNSTDVYAFIKANWGTGFPNYDKGAEYNSIIQESMSLFLNNYYDQQTNENKLVFVYKLLGAVKTNPAITNWTTPIN